jgi:MFS family permease
VTASPSSPTNSSETPSGEAIEAAAQIPGARAGTIEVRPIWELEPQRAPIDIGNESTLATRAPTSKGIVIAYGLMLGGFVLLGGRMADLVGRRRLLLTGLTLFSSASLLAGVAGSAGLLIGGRALQDFGAALVAPAALSILAVTFAEGAERNRALVIYGAVTGISASAGVIAGGLLTAGPGWRWVFFINVPVGVLLMAMAAVFLAVDARDRRRSERFVWRPGSSKPCARSGAPSAWQPCQRSSSRGPARSPVPPAQRPAHWRRRPLSAPRAG